MNLVAAIQLIESPLTDAIAEAKDWNDGAHESLVLAAQHVLKALELAEQQEKWNRQELSNRLPGLGRPIGG